MVRSYTEIRKNVLRPVLKVTTDTQHPHSSEHNLDAWQLVCSYAALSCNDMIPAVTSPVAMDEQSQLGKSDSLKDYSIHLMNMCLLRDCVDSFNDCKIWSHIPDDSFYNCIGLQQKLQSWLWP